MAFCSKCGAQIEDNATVCPSCGATQQKEQQQAAQAYVNPNQNYANYTNGSDYTAQMDPNDIQQNKILAVIGYFGILFLVPLLAAQNSRFARFHANQSLVLFLADIVFGIVMVIPLVGWIVGMVGCIATLVFQIMGIVYAATGKAKEVPLLGKIKIIK